MRLRYDAANRSDLGPSLFGQLGAADGSKDRGSSGVDPRRFKAPLAYLMTFVLFAWRPLEEADVPSIVWKVLMIAGLASVLFQMARFKRWNDELKHVPLFLAIFSAAIVQVLVENFFVWVVAASDVRKYDMTVRPLQDNVALLAHSLSKQSSILEWLLSYHLAHIANLIVIFVCILFSPAWDQVPYSGFGMASRAILMHGIVRVCRVVCFMAVVMPNPRGGSCYRERFPKVPEDWWSYMAVGLSKMKGSGGCNDLIISGHAVAWMMPVMTLWTFYPVGIVRWLVAGAFVQTSIRTAMEGWHYSVDFILPAIICVLVWGHLDWVYSAKRDLIPLRPASAANDPTSKWALGFACVGLTAGTVGAFCFGS